MCSKGMRALWKEYPYRTKSKFVKVAVDHGFTKKAAERFIDNQIVHDTKYTEQREMYLPIYSDVGDSYQFDTVFEGKSLCWLLFVNVNTRKAYVYKLKDKGSVEVLRVMKLFKRTVKDIKGMTSDQDKAYTTPEMKEFMIDNGIDYRTTEDNDHNRLSIINRLIRTLRDMNGDRPFTNISIKRFVKAYNDTEHSTIQMKPDDVDADDEREWIEQKRRETDAIRNRFKLEDGQKVRVMDVRSKMKKKRFNLGREVYQVDSREGNQYVIKARDESVATYPRHRLHLTSKGKVAGTLGTKRGMVKDIISYNEKKDEYKVEYANKECQSIPSNYLREGRPTVLSMMERTYWGDNELPVKLKMYKR